MSSRHLHGTSTSTSHWSYMRMRTIWEYILESILKLWFRPPPKMCQALKNVMVLIQLVNHKSMLVNKLRGLRPIFFKDMSLLCLFLDPHQTSCKYWYLIKTSDRIGPTLFLIDKLVWNSNWYAMSSRGIIYCSLRTLEHEDPWSLIYEISHWQKISRPSHLLYTRAWGPKGSRRF